jgi:hypothetical protein
MALASKSKRHFTISVLLLRTITGIKILDGGDGEGGDLHH